MSNNEKMTEQKDVKKEEKLVTKYDRKMQKRKEQKEAEKRQKRISTIVSVVVVAALVCLVASFPIRTYCAINETYVTIGGENISRVEFDYNYNVVKNNYISQYGSFLSYFGMNPAADLSTQMYSDTLTWKDFFEKMAVENMTQTKALKNQAEAAGFTYDTTEDYKSFEEAVKAAAAEEGVAVKKYIQEIYGSYATLDRIDEFVKKDMIVAAFYDSIAEEKAPADEEIQAHYDANKAEYDSVDYRVTNIKAELPTEPTELADKTEAAQAEGSEQAYQPSEAEIAKAMEDAKKLAEEAEAKVATDGELMENVTKTYATLAIREWLFDDARKAGDTTVIEDTTGNQYYALAFEKRYLDESPSADVRIIVTEENNGQQILDEWQAGGATEDNFVALCKEYSIDASATTNGGLFEGVLANGMPEEVSAWLFDSARVSGDTTAITTAEGSYTYVMYYVGSNAPAWKMSIKDTLLTNIMSSYLDEIEAGVQLEDKKGKLNYLKVEAQEAATAETATATESAEATTATESTAATSAQ